MPDLAIFILGVFVTAMTMLAVLFVGRAEGRDPAIKGLDDENAADRRAA